MKQPKQELSINMLGMEIFAILQKEKSASIEEITKQIYNNQNEKNTFRIYRYMMILLKHDLLVPQFKKDKLYFTLKNNGGEP